VTEKAAFKAAFLWDAGRAADRERVWAAIPTLVPWMRLMRGICVPVCHTVSGVCNVSVL